MDRKFSLAYLSVPGVYPVEQIEMATECGYDFVSLRTIPMFLPDEPIAQFEKDAELFKSVKSALAATGMKVCDIELARIREDLDISSYEPALEKAAELGADNVLSSIWSEEAEFYIPKFADLCDMAQKYGIKVNLEFVPFAGVRNLSQVLHVLSEVNKDNARILIDTLHAHRARVMPEDLKKISPELFGIIHICDGPAYIPAIGDPDMIGVTREGRLYVGDGGIDIAGMLMAMPSNICSIELPNKLETETRGRKGHAKRCLDAAKAYFEREGLL